MGGIGKRLARLRIAKGWSMDDAAERLGIPKKTYEKYEYEERGLKSDRIEDIADAFSVDPGALFSDPRTVPVVGHVGAGAEVFVLPGDQGEFERVKAPDYATEHTVAVKIRGDSLGEAFEGWYAFYDEQHTPPLESDIGRLCVIGLLDGRVLIKKLHRGNLYGRFTLASQFGPPVYDVEVIWAAPVTGLQAAG